MAVWGIGAYYKGSASKNKVNDFLQTGRAYVGWNEKEAPALHQMLASIKIGDIIYIKSFAPRLNRLTIKAIGIVTENAKQSSNSLGTSVAVKWKSGVGPILIDITPERYRNNIFNNTLYEEFDAYIIQKLIEKLI